MPAGMSAFERLSRLQPGAGPGAGALGRRAPGRPSAVDVPGGRQPAPSAPLDADTLFRIGSVTKTFTAVLVLQCRDDGLLDLDDPLGRAPGRAGARRADHPPAAVAHRRACSASRTATCGTPCGCPGGDSSLADLDRAERVLPPGRRFHYSNLGFALLGQLVARLRGGTWAEVLAERVLRAAGTDRRRSSSRATGRRRRLPGRRVLRPRPARAADRFRRASGRPPSCGPPRPIWPAGRRSWPTRPRVDPAGAVLAAATLEEMRWPLTVDRRDGLGRRLRARA